MPLPSLLPSARHRRPLSRAIARALAPLTLAVAVALPLGAPLAASVPATPAVRAAVAAAPLQRRPKKKASATKKRASGSRRRGSARAVAAAPGPRATAPRSAAALAADLGSILSRREDGRWGVMVVSLTRGDTLFARDADTPMTPASTLKMFTSVLALDRLGPDWRFSTDALRDGTLEADGTLRGNLVLRGDGDPSLSRRFHRGGYDAPMQELAAAVAAAGVKRVTGDLVADASAFESRTIPEGWLSRYAGSGYAAPFSALSLNENIVVVAVSPDGSVSLEPATTGIRVENGIRVTRGGGASLHIYRATDGHVVARGTIGRAAGVRRLQLTVADPVTFTAGALRAALASKGITIAGATRAAKAPASAVRIAAVQSPPLAELVAVMNRESINHFAELIFRNAVRGPQRDGEGSAAAGNALLQRFLTERVSAKPGAAQVSDGSGLSVLDRVTPRGMVQLLAYAHRAPFGSAFHASLPVAGESELMRHRMLGTAAVGNLHAKTGTTNDVIGLGGYVTAENGEVVAFSFIFNGRDRWNARATIDAMGATLAAFSREPAATTAEATATGSR